MTNTTVYRPHKYERRADGVLKSNLRTVPFKPGFVKTGLANIL